MAGQAGGVGGRGVYGHAHILRTPVVLSVANLLIARAVARVAGVLSLLLAETISARGGSSVVIHIAVAGWYQRLEVLNGAAVLVGWTTVINEGDDGARWDRAPSLSPPFNTVILKLHTCIHARMVDG